METSIKIKCFEYFISKIISWHNEVTTSTDISSFTKLKTQKLLFLCSSINATSEDKGLLNIFDQFYAMQLGPVESDIYDAMVSNRFETISFEERSMKIIPEKKIDQSQIKEFIPKIDSAISNLKDRNKDIVTYRASDLVDITHKWNSWKCAIAIASILGKRSEKMLIENICKDTKYFE